MRFCWSRLLSWTGVALVAAVSANVALHSQAQDGVAPDIPGVVAGGAKAELLQKWDPTFGGEGPIAMPDGGVLFAQQDANRIIRIDQSGAFSTYLENTNRTTGLAYDRSGRLLATGAVPPGILVLAPARSVLIDRFESQPFLRPKHLVTDRKGGVYFTDLIPVAAQDRGPNKPAKTEDLPPGPRPAIYYVTPAGKAVKASDAVAEPNGIMLSPDEKTLYVTNLPSESVVSFDVREDGSLGPAKTFAAIPSLGAPSRADGIAVDATGRVYVAAVGGVHIFGPTGVHLGAIPFSSKPGNLAFAGPDKKTLYIIGRGVAYKLPMLSEGFKGRAK